MAEPQYAPNHTIDPETGFLESNAYSNVFDAERKLAFLDNYRNNGLRLRQSCRTMGLSESTVNKHLHTDPVFKEKFEAVEKDYLEELEATSRQNALNPRSVIERIFQLKCLLPDKYGQENRPASTQITINLDGKSLENMLKRAEIVDAKIINSTLDDNSQTVDNQSDRVLGLKPSTDQNTSNV